LAALENEMTETLNFVYGSVSDDDRESLKDKRVRPDKDPDDDEFSASGWWVVTLAARPDAPFVARDIRYAAAVYYDCRDFNGDGRAEVQVLEGYETDHSVCLLELQGERLVSLGCAAGGD